MEILIAFAVIWVLLGLPRLIADIAQWGKTENCEVAARRRARRRANIISQGMRHLPKDEQERLLCLHRDDVARGLVLPVSATRWKQSPTPHSPTARSRGSSNSTEAVQPERPPLQADDGQGLRDDCTHGKRHRGSLAESAKHGFWQDVGSFLGVTIPFALLVTVVVAVLLSLGNVGAVIGFALALVVAWQLMERCDHGTFTMFGNCDLCEERARKQRAEAEMEREAEARRRQEREDARCEEHRRQRELAARRVQDIQHLRRMQPCQFEHFVLALFEAEGWKTRGTPPSGDDGIDGWLSRDGKRAIVQCKRYAATNRVGKESVIALLGAVTKEGAHLGIFVTTGRFSAPARAWAREVSQLWLIDGDELVRIVNRVFGDVKELPADFVGRE